MKSPIVIVGGGVVGASIAYHLTERGVRNVLILEREDALGRGSTGKATGGVRAQFETQINVRLSLYSLDFFKNWNVDCGYEPRGYVFLATNDVQMDYLRSSTEKQVRVGYDGVRTIDRQEIEKLAPGLRLDDVVGGTFGPRDGFIDPLAALDGFATAAVRLGAQIEKGVEVREVVTEKGAVVGLETSNGFMACEKVVIASGAWSRRVAQSAGIELPVLPQRRQIVWARIEKPLVENYPMVIDLSNGFHFRTAKGTRDEILFAYADPDERDGFSTEFQESFIEKVFERARHRAPFLAEATLVREKCRAGLYENTPDHHAILGACDVKGLYLACGFSGHGVMHSPATGRALAEMILDGEASFLDVSSLALDRFDNGRQLRETAFI